MKFLSKYISAITKDNFPNWPYFSQHFHPTMKGIPGIKCLECNINVINPEDKSTGDYYKILGHRVYHSGDLRGDKDNFVFAICATCLKLFEEPKLVCRGVDYASL